MKKNAVTKFVFINRIQLPLLNLGMDIYILGWTFTEKCQSERTDSKEQDDGHGDIYTVCKL